MSCDTWTCAHLCSSISRREEPFPLAQHFHPDHHDPDDRVALTVRSSFISLFLSVSLYLLICIRVARDFSGRELQASPSRERTMPWKSRSGTIPRPPRCVSRRDRAACARESEERSVAERQRRRRRRWRFARPGRRGMENGARGISKRAHRHEKRTRSGQRGKTRRRPRKQVPGRPGDQPPRPAGEDPGHSPRFYKQPNTVDPPPVLPARVHRDAHCVPLPRDSPLPLRSLFRTSVRGKHRAVSGRFWQARPAQQGLAARMAPKTTCMLKQEMRTRDGEKGKG